MKKDLIARLANKLDVARLNRTAIAPLTEANPELSIDDAYQISLLLLEQRLQRGEIIVGKKIGVTSAAVMDMLNVRQPDFGFLTNSMRYDEVMPISEQLIQPRAEGELAFVLKESIQGPGITNTAVVAATEAVYPCFEVVDSRIANWQIKIQDTVADNASCGLFSINENAPIDPSTDLASITMTVSKNGEVISNGLGAAAMGDPVTCVSWLANTLGAYGISLNAGDVILSGSLVPLEPVTAGDQMTLTLSTGGSCSLLFS